MFQSNGNGTEWNNGTAWIEDRNLVEFYLDSGGGTARETGRLPRAFFFFLQNHFPLIRNQSAGEICFSSKGLSLPHELADLSQAAMESEFLDEGLQRRDGDGRKK